MMDRPTRLYLVNDKTIILSHSEIKLYSYLSNLQYISMRAILERVNNLKNHETNIMTHILY